MAQKKQISEYKIIFRLFFFNASHYWNIFGMIRIEPLQTLGRD